MAPNATRYRLEALLRIKLRDRQRAEIALAKAIMALKKEQEKMATLEKEREEIVARQTAAREQMGAALRRGGRVFDGRVHVNFRRKLDEDLLAKDDAIDEQRDAIRTAEQKVARRRRDYLEAAKQFHIMEKHKELWRKKQENELSRKEEKEFDELANTIHALRRWRGEEKSHVTA